MEIPSNYSSSSLLANDSILIVNPAQCREKLSSIITGTFANLQILADFDFTLSKYAQSGAKLTTTYELLKYVNSTLAGPQYREVARG